jgi:hypothetical protein
MASPNTRRDLKALRRLVNQADLVLATIPDPHPSIASARESLAAALALAKELATVSPAVALGAKGGNATKAANLSRDPDYYKNIAAMRKTRSGGRPRKAPD